MRDLQFQGVTVQFGSGASRLTAVDDISLEVPAGTVVGLVGESGSGKSTLAKAAAGLVPVSAGTVKLTGADGSTDATRLRGRRPVQMVFQDPYSSLDPRMTIGESVAEALPRKLGRTRRREEVSRLLELVGVDPNRMAVLPAGLSGGQRQRVALARALAADPEVVIADEITSALDVSVQGAVLNLVRDVQRRLGLGVLFISHNLAVVRYVSDVIAVMYLGRLVEVGPSEQVLTSPRHPYTRSLLDAVPVLDEPLTLSDSPLDDLEPPDPHQPPAGCHFHPRCPAGPLVHPERTACREVDTSLRTITPGHHAACHFADEIATPADLNPRRPL
jgi:peptide/nickel transport system ATP-binding protein